MEIKYLKDKFNEYDLKNIQKDNIIKWISNYEAWSHEWCWYLIALWEDWLWRKYDCWHCSCYWPLENWYSWKFTKEEIYKIMEAEKISNYDYSESDKKEILEFILNS